MSFDTARHFGPPYIAGRMTSWQGPTSSSLQRFSDDTPTMMATEQRLKGLLAPLPAADRRRLFPSPDAQNIGLWTA
jgi:hypothetical protein